MPSPIGACRRATSTTCRSPRQHSPVRQISRDTWVGMEGLDFYKERADIVTATVGRQIGRRREIDQQVEGRTERASITSPRRWKEYPRYAGVSGTCTIPIAIRPPTFTPTRPSSTSSSTPAPSTTMLWPASRSVASQSNRAAYLISSNFDNTIGTPVARPQRQPFHPVCNPFYTDVILGKGKTYDATIDTAGVYLTDTIQLSKQWILNAGVRLDDFRAHAGRRSRHGDNSGGGRDQHRQQHRAR